MSNYSFAAQVNFHTWHMARLRVPANMLEHRLESTAIAAANAILTELGIETAKSTFSNRSTPTLYALIGWSARGPHDPSATRQVISVLRQNEWKNGQRLEVSEFSREAELHGWDYRETADISRNSQAVKTAQSKKFLREGSTINHFAMMLFTRGTEH